MNYAYTRASLLIQAITCDMQEANIRAHADRIDQPIDRVFTDQGASGRTLRLSERPEGYRLLHTVQRGDHVFFSNIDRMGRGTVDILQTIDKFR